MKTFTIQIELKSDALIGSGEGFGAIIDSDIVFDDLGIPYIPAKRIKGCLKDSANEVWQMFNQSGINKFKIEIDNTFGKPGQESSAPVYFSNLKIDKYESNRKWLEYFREKYTKGHTDTFTGEKYWTGILSRDNILYTFTDIRQQTRINDETGVTDEHSLRTIRVINKGLIFKGEIQVEIDDSAISNTLALACLNLRHLGTKRNRGFGEVECKLFDGTGEVSVMDKLEAICTG